MGCRGLCSSARFTVALRWLTWRSLRSSKGLHRGCAAVCSGICLVRLCSFDRLPHLRARSARDRRGIFSCREVWRSSAPRMRKRNAGEPSGLGLASPRLRLPSVRFSAGWLVENGSWRWVFFINLPLALIVLWLTLWRVPESRNDTASRTLDWPGALLATAGLGATTYALIEASAGGSLIWISGLAGLGALAGFLVVEAHSAAPMMSPHLFRSRKLLRS